MDSEGCGRVAGSRLSQGGKRCRGDGGSFINAETSREATQRKRTKTGPPLRGPPAPQPNGPTRRREGSPRSWSIIGQLICLTGLVTLKPTTDFIISQIFDKLEGVAQLELGLWTLVIILPVLFFIRFLCNIFELLFWEIYWQSQTILLRKNMMRGILEKPGAKV